MQLGGGAALDLDAARFKRVNHIARLATGHFPIQQRTFWRIGNRLCLPVAQQAHCQYRCAASAQMFFSIGKVTSAMPPGWKADRFRQGKQARSKLLLNGFPASRALARVRTDPAYPVALVASSQDGSLSLSALLDTRATTR